MRWPLRKRFWERVHRVVNRLAWRFASPPGPIAGSAHRIDKNHPLWRLNDWCADHWVGWWVENVRRERD